MRLLPSFALVAAVMVSTVASASTTYSAVGDFSASNPSTGGVWSYGTETPGGTFHIFPGTYRTNFNGTPGYNYFGTADNNVPLVGRNTSGATSGGTYQPLSNALWLHPGDADNLAATVLFTAQTTGQYNISGLFERFDNADGHGNGVNVYIYENGTQLFSSSISNAHYLASKGFFLHETLSAGDTLSFVVDRNGEYSYDSTGLQATISQTPEPSSLALLGTGVMGMAGFARRKFARS